MIDCAVWWATPVPADDESVNLLSEPERRRFDAFRKEADQRRFLTGRVLAKSLVGERLGIPRAAVEIDATCPDCDKQHGPPRVSGAPVALSISHSGDRVGVALTGGEPVGLDVEVAADQVEPGVLAYALSETERADVARLPVPERAGAFFTYWSRKEAVLKATGRGLRIPLSSVTLSGPGEPPRLLAVDDETLTPQATRLADLSPGEGYRAAVAVLASSTLTVAENWWEPS